MKTYPIRRNLAVTWDLLGFGSAQEDSHGAGLEAMPAQLDYGCNGGSLKVHVSTDLRWDWEPRTVDGVETEGRAARLVILTGRSTSEAHGFSVKDGIVRWTFPAREQAFAGTYGLTLALSDGHGGWEEYSEPFAFRLADGMRRCSGKDGECVLTKYAAKMEVAADKDDMPAALIDFPHHGGKVMVRIQSDGTAGWNWETASCGRDFEPVASQDGREIRMDFPAEGGSLPFCIHAGALTKWDWVAACGSGQFGPEALDYGDTLVIDFPATGGSLPFMAHSTPPFALWNWEFLPSHAPPRGPTSETEHLSPETPPPIGIRPWTDFIDGLYHAPPSASPAGQVFRPRLHHVGRKHGDIKDIIRQT